MKALEILINETEQAIKFLRTRADRTLEQHEVEPVLQLCAHTRENITKVRKMIVTAYYNREIDKFYMQRYTKDIDKLQDKYEYLLWKIYKHSSEDL